jgi:hypothetical protein
MATYCAPVAGGSPAIRTIRAFALVVALSAALFPLTSGSASAQRFEPNCQTFTHRYFLSAGSAVPLRVGFVDTSLTVCRGSDGWITRAAADQSVGTTGPGTAAGFVVEPSLASVTDQRGTKATARYEGRLRICLAQRTPICSESHDYTIYGYFSPVGPTLRDRTRTDWSHGDERPGGVHYHENA